MQPEQVATKVCGNSCSSHARVDLVGALHRLEGDTGLLADVVAMFLAESPEMMGQIGAAIHNHDAAELRRSAHKLKGCLGYLCTSDVVQMAYRLECMGESCKLERAHDCFSELSAVLDEVLQALGEKTA